MYYAVNLLQLMVSLFPWVNMRHPDIYCGVTSSVFQNSLISLNVMFFMKALVCTLPAPAFLWFPQNSICKTPLSISPQGFTLPAFFLVKIICIPMSPGVIKTLVTLNYSSASTCLSPMVYAGMFIWWTLSLIGLCSWKLQKNFCFWGNRSGALGCAPWRKPE